MKPAELKLAMQLIDQISSDTFKPEDYEDDVKKRMLEAIAEKVEGKEITAEPAETRGAQVIDLMQALKASLGQEGEERRGPRRSARSTTAEKTARAATAKGPTRIPEPAARRPRTAKK